MLKIDNCILRKMNLGSFGTVHTYYKADIICLEAPEKILGSKGQLISEEFFSCLQILQNPNKINLQCSALASKKWLKQNN